MYSSSEMRTPKLFNKTFVNVYKCDITKLKICKEYYQIILDKISPHLLIWLSHLLAILIQIKSKLKAKIRLQHSEWIFYYIY